MENCQIRAATRVFKNNLLTSLTFKTIAYLRHFVNENEKECRLHSFYLNKAIFYFANFLFRHASWSKFMTNRSEFAVALYGLKRKLAHKKGFRVNRLLFSTRSLLFASEDQEFLFVF